MFADVPTSPIVLFRKDIVEIFEVVDLDDSEVIEYKEFLVALTVAHTLGLIELSQSQKAAEETGDTASVTANDVKSVCNLIVSAFLLFDPTGKGFITRKSVEEMIKTQKGDKNKDAGSRSLLLNEDRWKEMVDFVLKSIDIVIFHSYFYVGLGLEWRN